MSTIQKKQLLDPDILIALKDHKNTEKKIQALQSELRFLQQKTPSLHDTVVSMLQNDLQQVSDLQYYHYIAFSKRIAGETLPPYEEYKIQLHLQCMERQE